MVNTKPLDKITAEVTTWPGIVAGEHRHGGTEYLLDATEIGHVHRSGLLDILFSRRIRDQLVSEGLAEQHRILPDTGWVSFAVHTDDDVGHALWLLRLSYLQKRVLNHPDLAWESPEVQDELAAMGIGPALKEALSRRIPA